MSSLNNIITDFISLSIVPEIANRLTAAGYSITVGEVHSILELTQRVQQTPPMGFSFPSSSMKGTLLGAPTRAKKAPVQVDPNAPQCRWLFTRVPRKGERCTNPADPITGYCKACVKKEAVKKALATGQGGVLPHSEGVQPTQVGVGGQRRPVQMHAKDSSLDAHPLPGRPGMYMILPERFIAQQQGNGDILVVSVENNGQERELTYDEVLIAESKGLQVPIQAPIDTQGGSMILKTPTQFSVPPSGFNQQPVMRIGGLGNGMPTIANRMQFSQPILGAPNQNNLGSLRLGSGLLPTIGALPTIGSAISRSPSALPTVGSGLLPTLGPAISRSPSGLQSIGSGLQPLTRSPHLAGPGLQPLYRTSSGSSTSSGIQDIQTGDELSLELE